MGTTFHDEGHVLDRFNRQLMAHDFLNRHRRTQGMGMGVGGGVGGEEGGGVKDRTSWGWL